MERERPAAAGPRGRHGGAGGTTAGAEIGAACAAADDCKSGFCFDDICCRSDCSGLCQSCAQPGSVGTCMNVPVGTDPRDECPDDGVAGCMRDGFCDGTGACAVYARGTICRAQTCAASTVTHAALCDGDGTCGATTNDSCGQYLCGSDGKCRSSCTTAADCVAGAACVNGSCGPKPPGAPCTTGGDCASTFCAQGVCCKTACAGTCKSCAIAGSEGECIDVPSGADPLSQCADEGAMTCGSDGTCDGAGACRAYSGATTCAAAHVRRIDGDAGAHLQRRRRLPDGSAGVVRAVSVRRRRRLPDELRERRRLPGAQRLHGYDVRAARRGWSGRRWRRRRIQRCGGAGGATGGMGGAAGTTGTAGAGATTGAAGRGGTTGTGRRGRRDGW